MTIMDCCLLDCLQHHSRRLTVLLLSSWSLLLPILMTRTTIAVKAPSAYIIQTTQESKLGQPYPRGVSNQLLEVSRSIIYVCMIAYIPSKWNFACYMEHWHSGLFASLNV